MRHGIDVLLMAPNGQLALWRERAAHGGVDTRAAALDDRQACYMRRRNAIRLDFASRP